MRYALIWNVFDLRELFFFSTGHMLHILRDLQVRGFGILDLCLLETPRNSNNSAGSENSKTLACERAIDKDNGGNESR